MAGKVLDLEVEIEIMSTVLGSTSTSCPFLSLIVQLKPHIMTNFKCFVTFLPLLSPLSEVTYSSLYQRATALSAQHAFYKEKQLHARGLLGPLFQ
jgi:hypothetical protein